MARQNRTATNRLTECLNHLASSLETVNRLRFAYNQPKRNLADVVRVIRSDGVLLTRFEKLARSVEFRSDYTSRDPLEFVIVALGNSGMNREMDRLTHDVAYFDNLSKVGFDYLKYQLHSILTASVVIGLLAFDSVRARIAGYAQRVTRETYDAARLEYDLHFLAMVHDMGKLVIGEMFPKVYAAMKQRLLNRISDGDNIAEGEAALLKPLFPRHRRIDHTVFAGAILRLLGYDRTFCEAITQHHMQRPSSNELGEYLRQCHKLFVRGISTDDRVCFKVEVDVDSLKDMMNTYKLSEANIRGVLLKAGKTAEDYLAHSDLVKPNGAPPSVTIADEDTRGRLYRRLNNAIFDILDEGNDRDRLVAIDRMLARLQTALDGHYYAANYLLFDVANHTSLSGNMDHVSAEEAMAIFHRFVSDQLDQFNKSDVTIVNTVGDSYLIEFRFMSDAFTLSDAIMRSRDVLSMKAKFPFSFYYYLHSGRELRAPILEGGQRYSRLLNDIGHISKELKERDRMIITQSAYEMLDREVRERFEPHVESSDGIQTMIDAADR